MFFRVMLIIWQCLRCRSGLEETSRDLPRQGSRPGGIGWKEGARLPLASGFEDGDKEWEKWDKTFQGLKELEEKFKAERKES